MGFLNKLTGSGKGKRVEPYGLWESDAEQLERFVSEFVTRAGAQTP